MLLKNLFVFVFALVWANPVLSDGIAVQWDGNTATAYPIASPLWKYEFPKDFPKKCLKEATPIRTIVCDPVMETIAMRFDLSSVSVLGLRKPTLYTVTATTADVDISKTPLPLVTDRNLTATIFMIWLIAACLIIIPIVNGWTQRKRRHSAFFFLDALGTVAIGGLLGASVKDVAFELLTTTSVLVSATIGLVIGGFTGKLAGGLIGEPFGWFACAIIGMFTSILTSQYGWIGAGITEYLVFLGAISLAGFALREVVAFIAKWMREPQAEQLTTEL